MKKYIKPALDAETIVLEKDILNNVSIMGSVSSVNDIRGKDNFDDEEW